MYDLILEGKIVDPVDGVRETRIAIKDNRIERIDDSLDGRQVLTTNGYVFPGFIDPHVHLRDFDWKYKEDYASGTRAALNGGVTTVIDMPNLPKPTINRERVLEKKARAARDAVADVYFYAGVSLDNIVKLEELQDLVVGYKIFTCESTGNLYLPMDYFDNALQRIERTNKPVTVHCEDQKINDDLAQALEHTKYAGKHCDIRPAASEISAITKVVSAANFRKVPLNIAHISTATGLAIKLSYGRKRPATCEVTPHHTYFTSDDMQAYGAKLKTYPPFRSDSDKEALLRCLKEGKIEMLAADHAPHTLDDKAKGAAGIPGLDDYGRFVSWLLKEQNIDPQRVAQFTSYNAAKLFGFTDRARIAEGFLADLTVIDFDEPGKPKQPHKLYTKCGWSPYANEPFPGNASYVIRGGRVVKTPTGLSI